jgi:hypothetical protein
MAEIHHRVQMGRWAEDMEEWMKCHPDATEAEKAVEARRLVIRYGLE